MSTLTPSTRLSFARIPDAMEVPDLIALQRDSFNWLLGVGAVNPAESGLSEALESISPIGDFTGSKQLSFSNPVLEKPKFSIRECKDRDLTYAAPLFVTAEFLNSGSGEIKSQTVFMGDFPLMTPYGTFVINGTERVVVSQLVRSSGVYFDRQLDPGSAVEVFSARFIPFRGAWLELEIDKRQQLLVRIDRKRRQSALTFLRALGFSDGELQARLSRFEVFNNALEKEGPQSTEDALFDIYRRQRPGEPPTREGAEMMMKNLFFDPRRYDLAKVGRYQISKKFSSSLEDGSALTREDILTAVEYLLALSAGERGYAVDDIDHLANRRIRTTGELVQQQLKIGLSRLERMVKERMTTQDAENITPQSLINIRPVVASLREFFGSSQLSQFMDQNNPLSGVTHRRRLSALGPGGLSRERAGFEVRDVHSSHYGRMCPIESPEGPNIGLIGSLSTFARINAFGFIETPYRKVIAGRATDEVVYLSASEEDGHVIAQANTPISEDGSFLEDSILVRVYGGEVALVSAAEVDYMDVSPRQMVSVGTALIPFLEHDDANRALMGANMQRQAVPLLRSEAPLVGTGMEKRAATDTGEVLLAEEDGEVLFVSADLIRVLYTKDKREATYRLDKFVRSNQGTCQSHTPRVSSGDTFTQGAVLADGPATENGEMALGKNLLVAFMTFEGRNYEDAIVLSERLVKEDVLTSIHIEEYETDARETKLGPEVITRDIPSISEDTRAHLDEEGIIRIGAEVRPGDVLIGKVTPKGETELTSEERLIRAIFGEKQAEVRDTSLRLPHGESGTVIGVRKFSRDSGDELSPGVNELVRIYIAQKRKIQPGDKLAGRHGNKGVISTVLPEEDMPFLEDGTPVDIVLNPLGVPSRMNIGQILETHLGWVAASGWKLREGSPLAARHPHLSEKAPGIPLATPVFDGAREDEITELLSSTLPSSSGQSPVNKDGKARVFDGRTGEELPTPITVGYVYILKLHHLVDDKMHARSTGPYSMVTQQPLGGKAQFGGQRFGEMEVWALQAYGAAHTLQEILTVKSDDTVGRVAVYDAIVRGENIPPAGIPESFKVLMKEMQSLALNVEVLSYDGLAIDLTAEDEQHARAAEELGIDLSRREK